MRPPEMGALVTMPVSPVVFGNTVSLAQSCSNRMPRIVGVWVHFVVVVLALLGCERAAPNEPMIQNYTAVSESRDVGDVEWADEEPAPITYLVRQSYSKMRSDGYSNYTVEFKNTHPDRALLVTASISGRQGIYAFDEPFLARKRIEPGSLISWTKTLRTGSTANAKVTECEFAK